MAKAIKRNKVYTSFQYPFNGYSYSPDFRFKADNGGKGYPFEFKMTSDRFAVPLGADITFSFTANFQIGSAYFYDVSKLYAKTDKSMIVSERDNGDAVVIIDDSKSIYELSDLIALRKSVEIERNDGIIVSSSDLPEITIPFVFESNAVVNQPLIYLEVRHEEKVSVSSGGGATPGVNNNQNKIFPISRVIIRQLSKIIEEFGSASNTATRTYHLLADFSSATFLKTDLLSTITGAGKKTLYSDLSEVERSSIANDQTGEQIFAPFFNDIARPFEYFTSNPWFQISV